MFMSLHLWLSNAWYSTEEKEPEEQEGKELCLLLVHLRAEIVRDTLGGARAEQVFLRLT